MFSAGGTVDPVLVSFGDRVGSAVSRWFYDFACLHRVELEGSITSHILLLKVLAFTPAAVAAALLLLHHYLFFLLWLMRTSIDLILTI